MNMDTSLTGLSSCTICGSEELARMRMQRAKGAAVAYRKQRKGEMRDVQGDERAV